MSTLRKLVDRVKYDWPDILVRLLFIIGLVWVISILAVSCHILSDPGEAFRGLGKSVRGLVDSFNEGYRED
ncbi:MAG: hypothetical protein ACFFBS_10405 [Promethearchaeota archaeon]